jgi:hypothetical protein
LGGSVLADINHHEGQGVLLDDGKAEYDEKGVSELLKTC